MQILRHLPDYSDERAAIAIGNFDGMHLGHREVIRAVVKAARATRAVPTVLTFEPHPRKFFNPTAPNFRIAGIRDKIAQLRSMGVHQIIMPRFDAVIASMLAEDFLHRVLGNQLNAAAVVVGENFVFGNKRRGNVAMLKAWGVANKVKIVALPAVTVNGGICSSSAVREAMQRGDMPCAAALLGRPYQLNGHVVHGDGRGRMLGYPTANLAVPSNLMLPAYGVYAVKTMIANVEYRGVANIGLRPTIGVDSTPKIEVHLFDTMQDLYGKTLDVLFVHKIRDEKKFDTMENLKQQIDADAAAARAFFLRSAS